jgi:hypothetical protein
VRLEVHRMDQVPVALAVGLKVEPVDRLVPVLGRDLARPPRADALGRRGDLPRFGWRDSTDVNFGGRLCCRPGPKAVDRD